MSVTQHAGLTHQVFIVIQQIIGRRRIIAITVIAVGFPKVSFDPVRDPAKLSQCARDVGIVLIAKPQVAAIAVIVVEVATVARSVELVWPDMAAGINQAALIQFARPDRHRTRLKLSPCFVKYHPRDNRRMIVQLRDHVGQGVALEILVLLRLVGFVTEVSLRRQILPNEHAENIAPVVPTGGLYFEVLAKHVEAHLLRLLDLPFHGLVRRRRQPALRPERLIEQPNLVAKLVVQQEARHATNLSRFNLAHTEVAFHPVDDLTVFRKLKCQVVKKGALRAPKLRIGD